MKIDIKPLSVNVCWQGKRFKTPKYKSYEKELLLKLPNIEIDFKARLKVDIVFGYSNTLNDIDNALKPFLDVVQKRTGMNDRMIYELNVKKEIVSKGKEFIDFTIVELK